MKPGHEKTRGKQQHEYQLLKERINAWKVPHGPFDWHICGRAMTEAHGFYNETFRLRQHDWYNGELSDLSTRARDLWDAAFEAAYPPGFWTDYEKLRTGNPSSLENAIAFLEAEPIFFGTGYVKTKITRAIKPSMLTPTQAARLRHVALSIVDRRDDRDFRAFCRLARKADAPELHDRLRQRLTSADPNIRRRAGWMLDALEQPR